MSASPSPSQQNTFVAQIDLSLSAKLSKDLEDQGFTFSTPPYTIFSAKKSGVSCTLYQSGKLTVQGKEMSAFIEFYLEPEILKTFAFTNPAAEILLTPRIGIDEAGKGDFFGPLCIAGVFAGGKEIAELKAIGVKDSKNISDKQIHVIAKQIKDNFAHHIVKINPSKYNEIYPQFNNLNKLLAWGHATTIEHLVAKTGCNEVIIDQFANEWVVISALKRKKLLINLTQRHRGEEDPVVAAASILARHTFLDGLEKLSLEFQMDLPKGASSKTIQAGREFMKKYGSDNLSKVGKMHFKTLDAILGKQQNE